MKNSKCSNFPPASTKQWAFQKQRWVFISFTSLELYLLNEWIDEWTDDQRSVEEIKAIRVYTSVQTMNNEKMRWEKVKNSQQNTKVKKSPWMVYKVSFKA